MSARAQADERCLRGVAAAPGIALGPAHVLDGRPLPIARARLDEADVPRELSRLRVALDAAASELESLAATTPHEAAVALRPMLDAYLAMHRDPLLVAGCERAIRDERKGAEWAVRDTVDALCAQLSAVRDPYLRERAADVAHVGDRIVRALLGRGGTSPVVPAGSVIVAHDLGAAEAVALLRAQVAGLVLELGSPTSHTAILARTLQVPVVVGVADAVRRVPQGARVVVDALRGEVRVDPDEAATRGADERARRYGHFRGRLRAHRDAGCATRDGLTIALGANVEQAAEAAHAVREGAAGVALFRTEYLYLGHAEPPDEDAQARLYAEAARALGPQPLVIRTFDLGADKLAVASEPLRAANPALGLRGLRLALTRPDLFRTQLRAILRAAVEGDVRLMFPMVAGVADLRAARSLVERAVHELAADGLPHRRVPVGAMIEVPSAALMADALARECDFFSVGTNDLVQYALAVDRGDPRLAALARAHDPAVLRLLDATARAAAARGVPLAMCGDMAGDPRTLPLAIGLGYTALGMPLPQIPLARAVIAALDADEVRAIAREALGLATAEDVEALVVARLGPSLHAIWEEQGLEN